MKERPTPETDAEHKQFAMGGFTLDFCRKLERERDEAREELRTAVQERHDFHWELLDAIRERNEAREEINRYREKLDLLPISWDV